MCWVIFVFGSAAMHCCCWQLHALSHAKPSGFRWLIRRIVWIGLWLHHGQCGRAFEHEECKWSWFPTFPIHSKSNRVCIWGYYQIHWWNEAWNNGNVWHTSVQSFDFARSLRLNFCCLHQKNGLFQVICTILHSLYLCCFMVHNLKTRLLMYILCSCFDTVVAIFGWSYEVVSDNLTGQGEPFVWSYEVVSDNLNGQGEPFVWRFCPNNNWWIELSLT